MSVSGRYPLSPAMIQKPMYGVYLEAIPESGLSIAKPESKMSSDGNRPQIRSRYIAGEHGPTRSCGGGC